MNASSQLTPPLPKPAPVDWRAVLRQIAMSRALDDLEESKLLPERQVLYQFSARGHELTQVLLGHQLVGSRDGVGAYYRSRPLLLSLGLGLKDALASSMMRVGGMSEGRDIGVVFNLPRKAGACVLPVCGGVGAQYTPAVGWAQALRYRATVLGDKECENSIAVAHGGDASTATNGFWAALNIVTTERGCCCCSSSRIMATVFPSPRGNRLRAAISPEISRAFVAFVYSTAMPRTRWRSRH